MSKPDDIVRLRHMLDAARKAVELTRGCSREDLDKDEKLTLALLRLLEITGEAAKGISGKLRRNYPDIPWLQITGTRDRLIHGYYDVDLNIIWRIVSDDIPSLTTALEKILQNEQEQP